MDKKVDLTKIKIDENSFRFVYNNDKIADKKLTTKATSFAQDSFRRFCKNKSSIVGAIVLGILIIMSLIVPIVSPYPVNTVSADETFLEPKLFKAGTGFWDGTRRYEKVVKDDGSVNGVLYDFNNETPARFYKPAVMNLVVDSEPTLINSASDYGRGGYVMFENQVNAGSEERNNVTLYNSTPFSFNEADNMHISVSFGNDDDVIGSKLGEYRIYLAGFDGENAVLKDWSRDYGDIDLNVNDCLRQSGITGIIDAVLYFELKPGEGNSYILIKKCLLTSDNETLNEDLTQIGFDDATEMIRRKIDSAGVVPFGYWKSTGRKGIYASEVFYCSFTYDTYEVVYGEREVVYTITELRKFKEDGLCDFDEKDVENTFVKLKDECPIESVFSPTYNPITKKILSIKALVPNYYKLGYTKMPKFILGTDASGIDLFTRMFTGLRTSLILGVCTAAFCFLFGLTWGSISGYFGGVVDLTMERFCDILGGIPWIVIMTLAILKFGNNFLTFFLALCLTGWMGTAARTRTQFYRFKGGEYVLASRTLGARDARLIFKHILPNSLGTIVTSSVLMIVSTIYSESTLAYLNLGLQGVQAFGVLLANNQQYIQSNSYLIVFPSIIMALLMISFNLFGNGLRDALNPSLRGTED